MRCVHLQRGKDVKPSAGPADRRVEGDVLGGLAAFSVDAAVAGRERGGQAIDGEPAEGRAYGDRRQRRRDLDLAREDFAELGRFEGLVGRAAPDRMPAIVRAPALVAQRPDVVVARHGIGHDAGARRIGVEPGRRPGEGVGVDRLGQDSSRSATTRWSWPASGPRAISSRPVLRAKAMRSVRFVSRSSSAPRSITRPRRPSPASAPGSRACRPCCR